MSYLYALQMLIPNYAFRPVKIGFSVNPEDRTKAFSGGPFPVVCLGYWKAPNGRHDERSAHAALRDFRLYGEWFYPSPQVQLFIEQGCGRPLSGIEFKVTGKTQRFDQRFRSLESRQVGSEEPITAAPPLPDPFDYPFPLPYEDRVDVAMRRITSKWPVRGDWEPARQLITAQDLMSITGLGQRIINERITRIQIGRTIRYRLKDIREFLVNFPQYLERIAA